RAQFDAGRYAAAADSFRQIVEASPSDDYAHFGLGLALARDGNPAAAAEHLALAAAMRPDLPHYTDALRGVRATLRARAAPEPPASPPAGARLLAERLPPAAAVLVVGGIGLRVAVRERGFRPVSVASERPAAVIQGYAPDLGYALLAEGALAVQAGALFVVSNADKTLPSARGRQPGNGSL